MAKYKASGFIKGTIDVNGATPWWVAPAMVLVLVINITVLVVAIWLVVSAIVSLATGVVTFWVIVRLVVGILLLLGSLGGNK